MRPLVEQVREEERTVEQAPARSPAYQRWARWRLRKLTQEQYAKDWSQDPSTQLMAAFRRNVWWIALLLTLAGALS